MKIMSFWRKILGNIVVITIIIHSNTSSPRTSCVSILGAKNTSFQTPNQKYKPHYFWGKWNNGTVPAQQLHQHYTAETPGIGFTVLVGPEPGTWKQKELARTGHRIPMQNFQMILSSSCSHFPPINGSDAPPTWFAPIFHGKVQLNCSSSSVWKEGRGTRCVGGSKVPVGSLWPQLLFCPVYQSPDIWRHHFLSQGHTALFYYYPWHYSALERHDNFCIMSKDSYSQGMVAIGCQAQSY